MADYKTIHGTTIKSYTTDPDNPIEGQVWYDKTNKVLQFQIPNLSTGAWRTGNSLGTARYYQGSAGLYTSGIVFGGESTGFEGKAEAYDGTNWTEVSDLSTARSSGKGAGASSTSALMFGGNDGSNTGKTETWNGSSWTEVGDMNTARVYFGGFGHTNTNALAAAGYVAPNNVAICESWNGTSWTEVADVNTARRGIAHAGESNTAGLIAGGAVGPGTPGLKDETETWNGTAWTEVNDINQNRVYFPGIGTKT